MRVADRELKKSIDQDSLFNEKILIQTEEATTKDIDFDSLID